MTFQETLKLQRELLSVENPLVMNTMDNVGYAYTMSRQYNKAAEVSSKTYVFICSLTVTNSSLIYVVFVHDVCRFTANS